MPPQERLRQSVGIVKPASLTSDFCGLSSPPVLTPSEDHGVIAAIPPLGRGIDADETSQRRCQAGLLRHLPNSGLGDRLFRIYMAPREAPQPEVLALHQQDPSRVNHNG